MINLKMLKAAVASIVLSVSSIANAGLLLEVDLTVENIITINATSGKSLVDASGWPLIGFYLANFFEAESDIGIDDELISGNLTSYLNTSDNTPNLYRSGRDTGLNVFSYTFLDVESLFEINQIAFSGQASWEVASDAYNNALNNASSGDIYFAADTINDIPNAQILGTWSTTTNVPEPSSIAILALGILGLASRRFKR